MPHLLIIRHTTTPPSATLDNKSWEVTSEGLQRAAKLATDLVAYGIGSLYTSSFPKTKITGQILADQLSISITGSLSEFNENDRQGVLFHKSRADFEAAIQQYFELPAQAVMGNESANDVATRFARGIESIIATNDDPNRSIAVVTHGVVPSFWLAEKLDQTPFDVWLQIQQLGMPCTFVFTLPDFQFVKASGV